MHFNFLSRVSPYHFVAVVMMVLANCAVAHAQTRFSINVASESVIESDRVDLGNIARITGESVRSDRLKNISLGYAPNVGMTREIARDQIILGIKAAGFEENEFALYTMPKTVVRRLGQDVSRDQVHQAVEKIVMGQFTTDGVSARITRLVIPEMIQVQTGKIEVRASMPGVRSLYEPFMVPVEIRVDNKIVRSFAATVEVEAFAEVFVAARDLVANDKLKTSDVRLERLRLERPISGYIRDTDRLRGVQLNKNVESGKPITSESFVASLVVKLGDPVRIEGRMGKVKIVITGEARSSGRIGDRIAVRNTQSGAVLQAVILDTGLVKVTF